MYGFIGQNGAGKTTTIVHDCWKPYFTYTKCEHVLCNVHFLRELKGMLEQTNQKWAQKMIDFLLGYHHITIKPKKSKYLKTRKLASPGENVQFFVLGGVIKFLS
ncbi:hypothetical protein COM14_14690 [Bacillus pseudomycoides]|nr:hypothetical protein COM14_14690 [Bacillus pseudomycoides]